MLISKAVSSNTNFGGFVVDTSRIFDISDTLLNISDDLSANQYFVSFLSPFSVTFTVVPAL